MFRNKFIIILLLHVLFAPFMVVNGQTRSELEAQRERILLEIATTDQLINAIMADQRASVAKISALNNQIAQRNELIQGIQQEISLINKQITNNQLEISKLEKEIEALKEQYAKMIVSAYKTKGRYDFLIQILTASDMNESYRRLKYYQQYGDARVRQAKMIETKQDSLQVRLVQLSKDRDSKATLLEVQESEAANLNSLKKRQQTVTNDLRKKEADLRREQREQKAISAELDRSIERLIAEEMRSRAPAATSTSPYDALTPEQKIVSGKFEENKGRLPWPTETGIVTSAFGQHAHPIFKNSIITNNGIDITTSRNSLVRSVFEGKVLEVFGIRGGNMAILIQHGAYYTAYQNLVDVMVKKGDQVGHKQTLARVYSDPGSGSSTLHFELWHNQVKMNPAQWLTPK